ncbi:MAG TPA: hypothetical protein VJS43_04535 [Candidatus Acidoferrales bacterium]|nr:hypothetical protein [Candidatus Acidoferrales bacterium]
MRRITFAGIACALCLATALAIGATSARVPASPLANLSSGKVPLTSAGPLAFGPDGILFVGDSIGGSVVAIDTGDRKTAASSVKINVDNIDQKIAALVGVKPDQILINDVKVNPISKNVYLSASRGRGPDAMPLILRVDAKGDIMTVPLDNAKYSSVSLVDAPESNPTARQNPRMQTITNMNYVNGDVVVAGLSNEEWSSALRSIPFPFKEASKGTTLQIWHSSHGRFETEAPIRTFVPYTIGGQPYILAAYTCTPLVKIPVSSLQPGAQVKGVEIADLGAGNQPLDMVPYKKDGHDYILIANTARGVMKLKADDLASYPAIAAPQKTDVAGVPYDTMKDLQNVQHLAQLDASDAVIVTGKTTGQAWAPGPPAEPVNLQTIALP